MPRLVNYASRFEFLRRAAFAIVLDRGVGALSRHAIARELGTSVSTVRRLVKSDARLTTLAMDEVAQRRRRGRWGVQRGEPAQVALDLLGRLLPDESHRIAEELVWWRLVIAAPTRAAVSGSARREQDWEEGSLREQFQMATQGWAEESDRDTSDRPSDRDAADQDPPDPLIRDIDDHDAEAAALIERSLDLLDVPAQDRATEGIRTRALLDGLNLAVCLGRLTPAEAVAALGHHVATVRVAA